MAGGTKQTKMKRDKMFARDPHCEQCGCELVHPRECVDPKTGRNIYVKNMATTEHSHSRLNLKRWKHETGERVLKLLCQECNQANATKDIEAVVDILKEIHDDLKAMKTRAERRVYIRLKLAEKASKEL